MYLDPQNSLPTVNLEAPDFAELLRLIQARDAGAARLLHRVLSPGVCFLLRRRLGRNDVDRQAQSVLETAMHIIETDISAQADGIPRIVLRIIQRVCAGQVSPAAGTGTLPWKRTVGGILDAMSSVEREALRKCYVLGEFAESVAGTLRLRLNEFLFYQSASKGRIHVRKAKAQVALMSMWSCRTLEGH